MNYEFHPAVLQEYDDHDSDSDIDVLVLLRSPVNPGEEIRRTGKIVANISLDAALGFDGIG